jgi:hypothetical protein
MMKYLKSTQKNRGLSYVRLAFIVGITFLFLLFFLWGLQSATPTFANPGAPNQSIGTFTDSEQDVGPGAGNVIALGDLDGDDDLDAFLGNQVWFNDGLGYFSDSGQNLNLEGNVNEMSLGDVDGDNDPDAIFAFGGGEPNQVWLNDGDGVFSNSGQNLGSSDSWALALGDVDGDDDLDAVFGNTGTHRVWVNDGTGVFTDTNQNLGNSGHRAVALEDLDGDDDLDAFFADCTIWLNDGSGVYTLKSQSLCQSDNVTLAMWDLDGDDDLDAFIGNATKHPNFVWFNDGAANFTDSGQSLGNSSSEQIALGDVDGDGDVDAFVGNTTEMGSEPWDKVWLNDGSGNFSDSGQELGAYDTNGAVLGDVDGDGDLDALVGVVGLPNRILWNGGTGFHIFLPIVLNGFAP